MTAEVPRIIVKGRQALQYIDAIEGLFDPQPYQSPESAKPVEKPRDRLKRPWFRPQQEEFTPKRDLVQSRLVDRWMHHTSGSMYAITGERPGQEPEGFAREFLYETGLYKINERPSLLVDAGESRTYQIDAQLLRLAGLRIGFSYLRLHHPEHTFYDAHILMSGLGVMRIEEGGTLTENYTPSFVEQRRLLAVAELFDRHKVIPRA